MPPHYGCLRILTGTQKHDGVVIFYYTIAVPIVALYAFTLYRLKFDRMSIAILLAACALSLSCFFDFSNWQTFSTDYFAQAPYVEYIAKHHALPSIDSSIAASRHPATYYILAAGFHEFGTWVGDRADPFDYVRYLSLILFSAFWVFAALTLRQLFPSRDANYYLCLTLMTFWPVGMTKTMFIGCDIFLYPAEMAVIYFIIRWLQEREPKHIIGAIYSAGVAILAKNNALLLVGVTSLFTLSMLWQHRRRLQRIFTLRLLVAISFMAVCCYSTLARDHLKHVTSSVPGVAYSLYDWLWMYFYFDPYEFTRDTMINPFAGQSMFHFWHYYLRSLLVGDYIQWRALAVLFAFGIVWQAMIIYILYGLWREKRFPKNEHYVWHFLLFMAAALTGMLLYRFHNLPHPNQIADGRYVYPIITIIVAFYGKTMEWHQKAGRILIYQIGRGMGFGFVLLTVLLVFAQNYILIKPQ
jgi:hypothetical protein